MHLRPSECVHPFGSAQRSNDEDDDDDTETRLKRGRSSDAIEMERGRGRDPNESRTGRMILSAKMARALLGMWAEF